MQLSEDFLFSQEALTFLIFCQTRSATKTQRELGLSASAVSRHLAAFEKKLGFPIVDKLKKPHVPTSEGACFAHVLESVIKPINKAQSEFRQKSSLRPALRVGILRTLSYELGIPLLDSLSDHVGNIRFLSGTSDRLMDRFLAKELDVILISRTYSDAGNIRRHVLFSEPTSLIIPKNLSRQAKEWTWPHLQFCGLPYIRYSTRGGGKKNQDFLTSMNLSFPERFEVDQTAVILKLVSEGKGWTLARSSQLLSCIDLLDKVCVLPMPEPVLMRKLYLLDTPSLALSLHQRMIETLLESIHSNIENKLSQLFPWMRSYMRLGCLENPKD